MSVCVSGTESVIRFGFSLIQNDPAGLLLVFISHGETVPSLLIQTETLSPTQHGPHVTKEVHTKAQ